MKKEKWTEKAVEDISRKYKSKNEFKIKASGAFKYAIRHKMLENLIWLNNPYKPCGFWNKENCEKESHKYKNKTEFKNGSPGAYESSRKNGWLDSYIWLIPQKNIIKDKIDSVYGYFYPVGNYVYIGRTINPQKRDEDHRDPLKNEPTYRIAYENGISVPNMTIIESGLTINEGAEREKYWANYYKKSGYTVINRNKCGGLGNITFRKWSKEKIIEEAKKYSTRKEFMEKNRNAYYAAWKNNMLNDLIPSNQTFKRGFWKNKENVLRYSRECDTLKDFMKKYAGAYDAAVKGGYLNELTWLNRKRKRT